jgi:hypothetical protein
VIKCSIKLVNGLGSKGVSDLRPRKAHPDNAKLLVRMVTNVGQILKPRYRHPDFWIKQL